MYIQDHSHSFSIFLKARNPSCLSTISHLLQLIDLELNQIFQRFDLINPKQIIHNTENKLKELYEVMFWGEITKSDVNLTRKQSMCPFCLNKPIGAEHSGGGVLPNKEVGDLDLDLTSSSDAKFGARSGQVHQIKGKSWEFLSTQDVKVGKKSQFWGHI